MATEKQDPGKTLSYTSVTEITAQGKRKSAGLFNSLRFWKKEKKNSRTLPQIGKPMQFQHLGGSSSRPIGTSVQERYQRAVSLPQAVTRDSALRSHASMYPLPLEKQIESDVERAPPRRILHRRATLPKLPGSVDDDYPPFNRRQSILDDGQVVDPCEIGFAVTSGSNFLKRRSRSAGALYAMTQIQTQPSSPTPWKEDRRRSDEIRYWRASVGPNPATDDLQHEASQDQTEAIAAGLIQETSHVSEAQFTNHDISTSKDSNLSPEQTRNTRKSFDFGGLTVTVGEDEEASIGERIVAMEVKLIDIEYSISKLQSSSTKSQTGSSTYIHKPRLNSDAATNRSVSTQPTTISLFSSPDESTTKSRLHIDAESANRMAPRDSALAGSHRANSLSVLTIDHLNSLLGLIRREQTARHRLEDQIVELQREFKALRQQLLPHSGPVSPYALHAGWNLSQRSHAYDDSETDDGFQDIFQTPTEFTARGIYGSSIMAGPCEGIAF